MLNQQIQQSKIIGNQQYQVTQAIKPDPLFTRFNAIIENSVI